MVIELLQNREFHAAQLLLEAVAHLPKDLANIMRCPITKRVLRVPVTASDGHTYEHGELIHWMESNDTSPVTGEHLSPKLIFNNQAQKFIRNLAPTMEEAYGASQDTGLQPSPKRKVIVLDSNDNVREPRMPKEDDPEDDEDDEDDDADGADLLSLDWRAKGF